VSTEPGAGQYWIAMEEFDEKNNVFRTHYGLLVIYVVDFVRISTLLLMYLTLLYGLPDTSGLVPQRNQGHFNLLLICCLGFLLCLNGLWNYTVRPNSTAIWDALSSKFYGARATFKSPRNASDIISLLWLLLTIAFYVVLIFLYLIQLAIFFCIFPLIGFIILFDQIIVFFIKVPEPFLFPWLIGSAAALTLWMLGIQSLLKLCQLIALAMAHTDLEKNSSPNILRGKHAQSKKVG
jgi:hypothetical protein